MKKIVLLLFVLPVTAFAQTVLTAEEAVSIALKSNYDISIAANTAAGDSILNAPGEAGMLPAVNLNGGLSTSHTNLHQRYTNGNEVISPNAGGTSMSAGVALSWTLFDGMKMFVTKQKLEQIEMQGDYLFRMQVINTSADVLLAYYDLVRQKQQLKATDEIIAFNMERVKITESRMVSGLGPRTDYLQAKIDLNLQRENRITLERNLSIAKQNFNSLLARDVLTVYDVTDSIPSALLSNRSELESKIYKNNPGVLAMQTQVNIANLAWRENRSYMYPRLVGNAGYNFLRTENSAGFTLYNQSYGWNAGLTLSMPLFAGGFYKRRMELAKIDMMNADIGYQQYTLNARLELYNALEEFDAADSSLVLERENEQLARENMNLALERLRLGQGTALEVAQAQATLAEVLFRLAGLKYAAKSAEINVNRQAA